MHYLHLKEQLLFTALVGFAVQKIPKTNGSIARILALVMVCNLLPHVIQCAKIICNTHCPINDGQAFHNAPSDSKQSSTKELCHVNNVCSCLHNFCKHRPIHVTVWLIALTLVQAHTIIMTNLMLSSTIMMPSHCMTLLLWMMSA